MNTTNDYFNCIRMSLLFHTSGSTMHSSALIFADAQMRTMHSRGRKNIGSSFHCVASWGVKWPVLSISSEAGDYTLWLQKGHMAYSGCVCIVNEAGVVAIVRAGARLGQVPLATCLFCRRSRSNISPPWTSLYAYYTWQTGKEGKKIFI